MRMIILLRPTASWGEADGKTFCSVFGAQEPVGFAVGVPVFY